MASLNKSPNEILAQILSYLSNVDLAATSLTSRRLRAVSEPLLYRAPCLSALRSNKHRPSLECFLGSLITSPLAALGTHVRSLQVEWDHSSRLDAVTYTGARWVIGFHRPAGFHGTHCVLLLHLLPSVHVLKISPPKDARAMCVSYLTHCIELLDNDLDARSDGPTLMLQSLREFYYPYQSNGGGLTVRAVLALMKLPCMDSLDVSIVDGSRFYSQRPIDGNFRFSSITKLRLSTRNMSIARLSVLLNAPIALTHFSYTGRACRAMFIMDLIDCFCSLRPSLQYLYLNLKYVWATSNGDKEDLIRRSVRLWPVLQTVCCSTVELLGNGSTRQAVGIADVLPRGLKGLQILEDRNWVYATAVDRVVELLHRKQETVPMLERIAMGGSADEDLEAHGRLIVACRIAGVKLVDGESFCW